MHNRSGHRERDPARRQLILRLQEAEIRGKLDFTVMLTVQTMNYLHSGFHRVAPVTGWRAPPPSYLG